jgi:hypothetical protein
MPGSAGYLWSKLAAYSDFAWHHPQVKYSKKYCGSMMEDGSDNMVGAVRVLEITSGTELVETVTE